MPDFVKFINQSDKPFDFHQNNRKRILQPGEDAIVPWGLAVTLFGHPGMVNVAPRNERQAMYRKVRSKFNYTDGLVPPEALEQGIKDPEAWWEVIRPQIVVFDIETNERVYMIIDDPDGNHASPGPASTTGASDMAALMNQIQVLTAQVNKMAAAQVAQQPAPAQGNTQSPTPTADGPDAESGESAFTIPVPSAPPIPTEDNGASVPLDLTAIMAGVNEAGVPVAGVPSASPDDPQAVPTGDVPPKMPPRPGQ